MQKPLIKNFFPNYQVPYCKLRGYKYVSSVSYDPNIAAAKHPQLFKILATLKYVNKLGTFDPFVQQPNVYIYVFKKIGKKLRCWSSLFFGQRKVFYSRKMFKHLKYLNDLKSTSISPFELRFLPQLRSLKLVGYGDVIKHAKAGEISRKTFLRNLRTFELETRNLDHTMLLLEQLVKNDHFVSHLEQLCLSCSGFGERFPIDWPIWNKLYSFSIHLNARSSKVLQAHYLQRLNQLGALGMTLQNLKYYKDEVEKIFSLLKEMNSLKTLNLFIELEELTNQECQTFFNHLVLPPEIGSFSLTTHGQIIENILRNNFVYSLRNQELRNVNFGFRDLCDVGYIGIDCLRQTLSKFDKLLDLELLITIKDQAHPIDCSGLFDIISSFRELKRLSLDIQGIFVDKNYRIKQVCHMLEHIKLGPLSLDYDTNHASKLIENIYSMIDPNSLRSLSLACDERVETEEFSRRLSLISKLTKLETLSLRFRVKIPSIIDNKLIKKLIEALNKLYRLKSLNLSVNGACENHLDFSKLKIIIKYRMKFLCGFSINIGDFNYSSQFSLFVNTDTLSLY